MKLRDWLFHFYSKHNPDMILLVDKIANQWVGDEMQLFHRMLSRYPELTGEYQWLLESPHSCVNC